MRALTIASTAAMFVFLAATGSLANNITNGSFEAPVQPPGAFIDFGPGGEPAGFDWTVSFGTVDVSALPNAFVLYTAYDGNQALDLNGNNNGGIYQDFATTAGQQYALTFAYADNSLEGGISTADVSVTDLTSSGLLLFTGISHSTSTNSPPNADWTLFDSTFTATGALTRLSFASTSVGGGPSSGIVLDAVAVTPVPEPASALLLAGLGCLAVLGRRAIRR